MPNVFVTKYALTAGIKEFPVKRDDGDGMVSVERPGYPNGVDFFHGRDWHLSREDAVNRAEEMRGDKIASLKKQLARLEKLKFT